MAIEVDFDHPFTVTDEGTVTDGPQGVYAPDTYHDEHDDMTVNGVAWQHATDWRALAGYTGQYGYLGPVMHPSEFIGGRLERDILSEPGTYVVTVVNVLPDDDGDDAEPAGWAVLRMIERGE